MSLTQKGLFLPSYIFEGGLSCNYMDFNKASRTVILAAAQVKAMRFYCEPAITVSTCLLHNFLAYRPRNSAKNNDVRISTHKTVKIKKLPSQWKPSQWKRQR